MIVDGNNVIAHYLKTGEPFCAGKIGVTELNILAHGYTPGLQHEAEDIAGMYPYDAKSVYQFKLDMWAALEQVNLIPIWNKVNPAFEEHTMQMFCADAHKTNLQHLEPYFFDKPWTDKLAGKKVLVISPFAESIKNNFSKLDKIWSGKIKPNFELKTITYPFALKISPHPSFRTSDEIYQFHLKAMKLTDFDVCITGTGYTSLLLAAQAKRMGKVGIHLGGSTQILFGVKGQRWREIKEFQPFFNEHWTDPLLSELPAKRNLCEEGCYW